MNLTCDLSLAGTLTGDLSAAIVLAVDPVQGRGPHGGDLFAAVVDPLRVRDPGPLVAWKLGLAAVVLVIDLCGRETRVRPLRGREVVPGGLDGFNFVRFRARISLILSVISPIFALPIVLRSLPCVALLEDVQRDSPESPTGHHLFRFFSSQTGLMSFSELLYFQMFLGNCLQITRFQYGSS